MFDLTPMSSAEIVQPSLFPFPLDVHLIFSCISLVFFAYIYLKERKFYQLIMAFAIPFSLAIWISDNRQIFYIIGFVELVLLITALVSSILRSRKDRLALKAVGDNDEAGGVSGNAADDEAYTDQAGDGDGDA